MKAWVSDAARFLDPQEHSEIKKNDLILTNKISRFIDDDDLNFVIAPKGFGKTLLLIYKRLSYKFNKKKGFIFIPHDNLVDLPKSGAAYLDWGILRIKFYQDRRIWEGLWRASISLSIIKKIKKSSIDAGHSMTEDYEILEMIRKDEKGTVCPLLRRLIYEEAVFTTPLGYINYILSHYSQNDIRNILKEMPIMDELISGIHIPIAIFIDNVDEYFEEHADKDKQDYSPSVRGIFDIEMWYASQQGLMFAVKTMRRSNSHLDIFASIRKEAYEKLSGTTVENIRGQCLDVSYSFSKLKNIFEKNVQWTDRDRLVNPDIVNRDPVNSFLGFDKLINESTKEEEDVFSYIYRHTLKRPRDIIDIGGCLRDIDNDERTGETIGICINEVATKIAKDYIKIFLPHSCFDNEIEIFDLFKLIPHNILKLDNLIDICSNFNNGCIDGKDCKYCDKKHIFCELYKLGLLGTVEFNITRSKYMQEFLRPGERTFESHTLNMKKNQDMDYYLVHPILNELIGGHPETKINKTITIGDGKDWITPELPGFLTMKYKIFLCHSHHDRKFVDKLAEDLRKSKIPIWLDKWNIRIADSIADEVQKGIEKSEYLGIVISNNSLDSAWVKKELTSALVTELEEKKIVILPILIDDVWDKVPPFLKEKRYANFKTSYENGLKELLEKLI